MYLLVNFSIPCRGDFQKYVLIRIVFRSSKGYHICQPRLFRPHTEVQGKHGTCRNVGPHGGIPGRLSCLRCDEPGRTQLMTLGSRGAVYTRPCTPGLWHWRFRRNQSIRTIRCAFGERYRLVLVYTVKAREPCDPGQWLQAVWSWRKKGTRGALPQGEPSIKMVADVGGTQ